MSDDLVILVPLDGSAGALPALSVAKVFAELEGASVRILHVTDQALPAAELARRLGPGAMASRGAGVEFRTGVSALADQKGTN